MPLLNVTSANGITTHILKAGARGMPSSLSRLIKYVLQYSSISSAWKLPNKDFLCYHRLCGSRNSKTIFAKHIHTENQNLHYKL